MANHPSSTAAGLMTTAARPARQVSFACTHIHLRHIVEVSSVMDSPGGWFNAMSVLVVTALARIVLAV